jgi:hypothetical protein
MLSTISKSFLKHQKNTSTSIKVINRAFAYKTKDFNYTLLQLDEVRSELRETAEKFA